MRTKLLGLYVVLPLVLIPAIVISLTGGNPWVLFSLLLASGIVSFLIMMFWLKYIQQVLKTSRQLITKDDHIALSFENLQALEAQYALIEKKFAVSAELIANLGHSEKQSLAAELDINDPIAKALAAAREEMDTIKAEEEKRSWINQGLAKMGEVLRNKADVNDYTYLILSNLVKYLNANQGALFIEYNDEQDQRFLELKASYAYGKRKFVENKIFEGQGLIGQCMLEKDFIFITDVPLSYVKITSGLGEATPRNIIVAPLIFNETFCGAIELASFQVLEKHQMEFLKKVCDNIASEIFSLKNIDDTKKLLEESNILARELQSREEEMKQNLEELAATEEEMRRKQVELTGVVNAIDSTLGTAEFDTNGKLLKYNSVFHSFLNFSTESMLLKNYSVITGKYSPSFWNQVVNREVRSGDFKSSKADHSDVWFSVTFTAVNGYSNQTEKILCLVQNITEKKLKEQEFERLSLVADNTDNSVIITDANGLIEYVNDGFVKITGYTPDEVIGKKPGKLLQGPLTDKATIAKLSSDIKNAVPVYEEILNYDKWGQSYWVSLAINPVKELDGSVKNYISIQADITETKIKALDFHQKMEALSRSNAIIEIDAAGNILDINENYLSVLGYEKHELTGKPYSLLSGKTDTFVKILETIKSQGMQSGVYTRFDKSGKRHCMKLMDYPVLNLAGEIMKIIEFGVDVSNEKRLEKEAERRQLELDSYLVGINNTIASAEFTMDGDLTSGNEIFTKVLGYSLDELKGKNFNYLMGEDLSVMMMWENLRLGRFFSGEFKMRSSEGKDLWLTGTFNPISIGSEHPVKIIMFAQFTTQEKEKFLEMNAFVHALKATLPVIEFNPDFACKSANEKALRIFGLSRLQLRNKKMTDFLPSYYHETWTRDRSSVVEKEVSTPTIPFLSGNQVTYYETSMSVSRNAVGEVSKIILILVKEVNDKVSVLTAV